MSALGTSGIGIIILILLAVPFKSLTTVDANFFPGSSLSAKTITSASLQSSDTFLFQSFAPPQEKAAYPFLTKVLTSFSPSGINTGSFLSMVRFILDMLPYTALNVFLFFPFKP